MSADVTPTLADKLTGYQSQSGLHALIEAVCSELRREETAEGAVNLIQSKGVRVLPEYHGDLINSLAAVLNRKLSVLISVGFSTVDADHESLSTMLKGVRLEISVFENVLINQGASGTRVSALTFAEIALSRLHQFQPEASAALVNPQSLRMARSGTLQMNKEQSELKSGLVCYTVRLVTGACLTCHCS